MIGLIWIVRSNYRGQCREKTLLWAVSLPRSARQGNGSRSREVRVIVINQPGNALVLFVRRQARRSQNKLLMGLGVTEFHAGAESAVVQG